MTDPIREAYEARAELVSALAAVRVAVQRLEKELYEAMPGVYFGGHREDQDIDVNVEVELCAHRDCDRPRRHDGPWCDGHDR